MDFGTVKEILSCFWPIIQEHAGYLIHYENNLQEFQRSAKRLEGRFDEVKFEVGGADPRASTKSTVEGWMDDAGKFLADDDNKALRSRAADGRQDGCCKGRCWNCLSRYTLGKRAKQRKDEADRIFKEGEFNETSHRPRPPSTESQLSGGDFHLLRSTAASLEDILRAIKEKEVVGVHGMGGVGKTTLIEEVARRVEKEKRFDRVVVVRLSGDSSTPDRIRTEIGDKIGLKFEKDTEGSRAGELCDGLSKKKFLIILDGLREYLNLGDVGIPSGKECKMVLTTRDESVCHRMGCEETVRVELLQPDDAWALFQSVAGNVVSDGSLRQVAKKLAKHCGRLPLAITTLARSLRGVRDKETWSNALKQLKDNSAPLDIPDVDKDVFRSLMVSYHSLDSDEAKLCFLLCCLFPDGYSIGEDDLAMYAWGEGSLSGVINLKDACARVHSQLRKIRSAGLLLEGDEGSSCVTVHEMIRNAAVRFASKEVELGFFVRSRGDLEEWPMTPQELRSCKRISITGAKIGSLPERLDCPNLLILTLQNSSLLQNAEEEDAPPKQLIPDGFFEGARGLRVLDLSCTGLLSLPSSLACLTDLRTLCLRDVGSQLEDLSNLHSLAGNLEVLCLSQSPRWLFDFDEALVEFCLPSERKLKEEIGALARLRCLDLTRAGYVATVPPNLLSSLTCLEQLFMEDSFSEWECQTEAGGRSNASLSELSSLPRLTVLFVSVDNWEAVRQEMPSAIPWKNLTRFGITIGSPEHATYSSRDGRTLQINGVPEQLASVAGWVQELLSRTCDLKLREWSGRNLSCLALHKLEQLEVLEMERCRDVEEVFSAEALHPGVLLKRSDTMSSSFLRCLKVLNINKCHSLKRLFPSWRLAQGLHDLQELRIRKCELIEAVAASAEEGEVLAEEGSRSLFEKLKVLELVSLPKLRSFSSSGGGDVDQWQQRAPRAAFRCPALEYVCVEGCRSLRELPLRPGESPHLKLIETDDKEWIQQGLQRMEDEAVQSWLRRTVQYTWKFDAARGHRVVAWHEED